MQITGILIFHGRQRTHWNEASPLRVIETQEDGGEIEITLNSASIALRAEQLLDSQLTQLKANVSRSSKMAPRLVKAYLYGNESVIAEIDIPETNATSSMITFEWEVFFRKWFNGGIFRHWYR